MVTKQALLLIIAVCLVLLLTGCIPGDSQIHQIIRQGSSGGMAWMAGPNIVNSAFFNNEIRIYEINNSSWLYDFGFYIAIIGGLAVLCQGEEKD